MCCVQLGEDGDIIAYTYFALIRTILGEQR